jgi:uncharacterized protein YjbI with pentapeptide repeats
MIKFDVKNRFTRDVQFTAEIDCADDENTSIKLGLAVKWGYENKADLRVADLRGADLQGANLRGANLRVANLQDADLQDADLRGANLRGANLRGANLRVADLRGADLRGADLRVADLRGANLQDADLQDADLRGANLWGARGNKKEVKSLQLEEYDITYTADVLQIGCKSFPINDWWDFDDAKISSMDSNALEWWTKWKPVLKHIIEISPATSTKKESE